MDGFLQRGTLGSASVTVALRSQGTQWLGLREGFQKGGIGFVSKFPRDFYGAKVLGLRIAVIWAGSLASS